MHRKRRSKAGNIRDRSGAPSGSARIQRHSRRRVPQLLNDFHVLSVAFEHRARDDSGKEENATGSESV
jgi:hypothetical protein